VSSDQGCIQGLSGPVVEQGTPEPASPTVTNKLIRNVHGEGKPLGRDGMSEVDTWLGMPGTSHFRLVSDEGAGDAAPCGLALLSAGIAFCYMTQLSRYIENMNPTPQLKRE
jgi:hypothetical protein